MSSYTTSAHDANPEIARGYQAVIFGNYQVHGGTVSIRDYDDTPLREASVFETDGILKALDDLFNGTVTDYSDKTRRMLDLAAGLAADTSIDLDGFDWAGWADSECSCYDLPDGRAHVCAACLDKSAARWDPMDIPF